MTQGMYGTAEAKKVASQLALVVGIAFKILRGNFFAAVELIGPVNALRSVDLVELKNELLELDPYDRSVVEQGFKDSLVLDDKVLQEKISSAVDILEQVMDLVAAALKVFDDGKDIVTEFRKLFGL